MTLSRSRMSLLVTVVAFATIIGGVLASLALSGTLPQVHAAKAVDTPAHIDCALTKTCLDVAESDHVFGKYVGHDEPANLFYSNVPGSGNSMRYLLKLPSDPTPGPGGVPNRGQSFNFQLHPAFWFGIAMCDTQSDPNQVSTCTPDSDSNIVDPAVSPNHPGTAFMEMQFYPPGWVEWPAASDGGDGSSCDPTKWCAALNIDSLSDNGVTGQNNNAACVAAAGLEYVNFAFITRNGVATGPASPLLATLGGTFTPSPADLFMNSGDTIQVTMHDTANGLEIDLNDLTTGQSGFMTASAANGFAEVKFDPNGTNCDPATHNIPTNFHPMYSTSSPATRVIWAAHSFNVAFSDEIGHFDYCTGGPAIPPTLFGVSCPAGNFEGIPSDQEPTDGDDNFCFPASRSSFLQIDGCTDANFGFDGVPYQRLWPDGNPHRPTPIQFSSPLTGAGFNVEYSQSAFETDLPAIEDVAGTCDVLTGAGCTLIPKTDDGKFAKFYPYYSITLRGIEGIDRSAEEDNPTCRWEIGDHIPHALTDFAKNLQYGRLLPQTYLIPGAPGGKLVLFEDFHLTLANNPCPVRFSRR